eukprot:268268-Rhodomonas_salina.5
MRAISPKFFFERVFKHIDDTNNYVDWAKTANINKYLQDAAFSINITQQYLEFKSMGSHKEADASTAKYPIINSLMKSMVKHHLTMLWSDTLMLFVLINIERVSGLVMCNEFINSRLNREVKNECMQLMADVADERYTEDEYANTIIWIFKDCTVEKTSYLQENIQRIVSQQQTQREAFIVRNINMNSGRLRLRDRLLNKKAKQSFSEQHSFQAFQTNANFASNVSYNTKLKLYMLLSQNNLDKESIFKQVLPKFLNYTLAMPPVTSPEETYIKEAITKMSYTKAPFERLSIFYEKCFKSIAFSHKNALSLTTIMQLYVACYQNENIWQSCWMHILPVMNSQVIRDIENFKSTYPSLDNDAFTYVLASIR